MSKKIDHVTTPPKKVKVKVKDVKNKAYLFLGRITCMLRMTWVFLAKWWRKGPIPAAIELKSNNGNVNIYVVRCNITYLHLLEIMIHYKLLSSFTKKESIGIYFPWFRDDFCFFRALSSCGNDCSKDLKDHLVRSQNLALLNKPHTEYWMNIALFQKYQVMLVSWLAYLKQRNHFFQNI